MRPFALAIALLAASCTKPAPPPADSDTTFVRQLGKTLDEHGEVFADYNKLARKICSKRSAEIAECATVIPRLPVTP
jgi:hypothetical protein